MFPEPMAPVPPWRDRKGRTADEVLSGMPGYLVPVMMRKKCKKNPVPLDIRHHGRLRALRKLFRRPNDRETVIRILFQAIDAGFGSQFSDFRTVYEFLDQMQRVRHTSPTPAGKTPSPYLKRIVERLGSTSHAPEFAPNVQGFAPNMQPCNYWRLVAHFIRDEDDTLCIPPWQFLQFVDEMRAHDLRLPYRGQNVLPYQFPLEVARYLHLFIDAATWVAVYINSCFLGPGAGHYTYQYHPVHYYPIFSGARMRRYGEAVTDWMIDAVRAWDLLSPDPQTKELYSFRFPNQLRTIVAAFPRIAVWLFSGSSHRNQSARFWSHILAHYDGPLDMHLLRLFFYQRNTTTDLLVNLPHDIRILPDSTCCFLENEVPSVLDEEITSLDFLLTHWQTSILWHRRTVSSILLPQLHESALIQLISALTGLRLLSESRLCISHLLLSRFTALSRLVEKLSLLV